MKAVPILVLLLFWSTLVVGSEVDIENEIKSLKYELAKQNQRIQKLESLTVPENRSTTRTVPVDRFAWHKSANWSRLKRGMTRRQVEAILGKPTRITKQYASLPHLKYLYQGDTSSSGYVSGYVNFDMPDDRVSRISPPVL